MTSLLPGIAAADDSDDDDDDDSSSPSFFSFGDSGKDMAPVKPSVDIVQPVDAIAGPSPRPPGPMPLSGETESESTPPDVPLQFRDRADAPLQFSQTQTRYPAPSHHTPSTSTGWTQAEDEMPQYDSMVSQVGGPLPANISYIYIYTIQYNKTLYCSGPGIFFFCSVRHKNIKYRSREIKIQINSLLKQYVNIDHNKIQD